VALEDQAALQLNPYLGNVRIDLARLLEAYLKMITLDPITHSAAELYQTGSGSIIKAIAIMSNADYGVIC
jgi:hypothetical protein